MKLKKAHITLKKDKRLYEVSCPIIGLTGGIATGKSTYSAMLREEGFPIIDADSLVKVIYKKEQTLEHLRSYYPQVINTDGGINFKLLREFFFQDIQIQTDIERLIYTQLPEAFMNEYQKLKKPKFIIYDVPLLFEKNLAPFIDYKVVVHCSRAQQIERLMLRDSITKELAIKILNKQINIDEKAKMADLVIDNSNEKDQLSLASFKNLFE